MKSIRLEPNEIALHALLGEVSSDEDDFGRGMLSAYVVSAEDGQPGGGFFTLAEKLGRKFTYRDSFWVAELKHVQSVAGSRSMTGLATAQVNAISSGPGDSI